MTEPQEPSGLDELTQRQLAETFAEPGFPADRIRERVRRTTGRRGSSGRSMMTRVFATAALAAAVLLTFSGGIEYGRRLPASQNGSASRLAADLPLAIQSAGTEYITAVAQYADLRDSLDSSERAQAREAALAVLYGVVVELLRSEAADADFARIIQAAMARERAATEAVLWF